MIYQEEIHYAKPHKQSYLSGLEHIVNSRQKEAQEKRNLYIKDVFREPERYRNDLKKMLGWPLVDHAWDSLPMAQSVLLSKEDGYSIYRMSFEIMEGLTMTGLFFWLDTREKRPLVIVQHGGQGTPELICGMYGSTTNYRDMLHRVLRQGVHVFAPQLLLWGESYEVPYDRAEVDAQLKRLGSSITAVEVYGIMRILDYFQTKDYVKNFGMVGLSYGGFYTLTAAALDPRIESAISCAFFNSRDKVGWTDWTWRNAAYHFDDAEIACLVYPRQLTIAIAREDELFSWQTGEASYHRLEQLCDHVGTDWVDFKLFSGKHEFFSDDEPIKKLVKILEG